MKKTVIKFGLYSFFTGVILFFSALVFANDLSLKVQELLGYSSMVISCSFIYFGIKYFRDQENSGKISFTKALGLGMLITLFAAIGFAMIDYIYTAYINPEFVDYFVAQTKTNLEQTFTGDELASKISELEANKQYMTSSFMAILMFVTVILIGFVISLISSLVLNKK